MNLLNFSFEPSRIEIYLETCFSKVILRNFHLFEKNLSCEHFHVKVGVYIVSKTATQLEKFVKFWNLI